MAKRKQKELLLLFLLALANSQRWRRQAYARCSCAEVPMVRLLQLGPGRSVIAADQSAAYGAVHTSSWLHSASQVQLRPRVENVGGGAAGGKKQPQASCLSGGPL